MCSDPVLRHLVVNDVNLQNQMVRSLDRKARCDRLGPHKTNLERPMSHPLHKTSLPIIDYCPVSKGDHFLREVFDAIVSGSSDQFSGIVDLPQLHPGRPLQLDRK